MLREALGVTISSRDGVIRVGGGARQIGVAKAVLERLARDAGAPRAREAVLDLIAHESAKPAPRGWPEGADSDETVLGNPERTRPEVTWDGSLHVASGGRPVQPKTPGQRLYIETIRDHDLAIGIGPAGTGKTFLAVAAAVQLLKIGAVQRVVLARPAVEAGERLGFLPGDMQEKVNPYLRPLLDALHDMLDFGTIRRFMENDVIEISPLAFMRGRTLNNAVILLDEAQNTTRGQMKMFLTRMGHGSRVIITGDTTQIDLPDPTQSGLIDAVRRLRRVPGVGFAQLNGGDVVRHTLVQRIVEAYGDEEHNAPHAQALREALHPADL
ncbi:MAG: PhoH family protein [Phycisphaeraceae bacterium]|nr:MAG: PhoH family protein [Phycisphaeraceae bacterium]